MRRYLGLLIVLCVAVVAVSSALGNDNTVENGGFSNPFFAFDNGTGRGELPAAEQAAMLAEMGYAGIGYTGTTGIPEMLEALDKQNLEMFSTYVGFTVGENGPEVDPSIKEAIQQLHGRNTIIWLTIRGGGASSDAFDDQAVDVLRELSDCAQEAGIRIALYPHFGFYVSRVEDAIRLVQKTDRDNVGASLNLCHWLKTDNEANLQAVLKAVLPHLFLVSINGADSGDTQAMGWDRLIQTLDQGTYDVQRFVRALQQHGYVGPIGLQCYAIQGDMRTNLQRSIKAWRSFTPQSAKESSFKFEETSETTLTLTDGDAPVLAYNFGVITNEQVPETDLRRRRSCYIHPVWGLDGEVLTDDFPRDHYHHHGVFWTWPHVQIEGQEYDLWADRGIRQKFLKWICRETHLDSADLAVENGWFVGDQQVMTEQVFMHVSRVVDNGRALDLKFCWTPTSKPVTLWGAPGKSYGGLTVRFAVKDQTKTTIIVPEGVTTEDLRETRLPWADLTYPFLGADQISGGAIFIHPKHPDFPPTWLTRHYGPLCVGWPGVRSQTFEVGQRIETRYRIWLHRGKLDDAELQHVYDAYTAECQ